MNPFFHVPAGIEAADLTSLLEQFEETQGNQLLQQLALFLYEVPVGRLFHFKPY